MKPSFKETRKFLSKIPAINLGGCGVSALALFDAAVRDGKKPKVVYLYGWLNEEDMIKNNKFKEGKRKKAAAASHVVVKIGKKYWDSTGEIKESELSFYGRDEEITRKHLIASINNKGAWNDVFKRKTWIPKIAKYIKGKPQLAI